MTKRRFVKPKTEPCVAQNQKTAHNLIPRFLNARVLRCQLPKLSPILLMVICTYVISRPFEGASHGVSRASMTCATTVNNSGIGERTARSCPSQPTPSSHRPTPSSETATSNDSGTAVHDKYFICDNSSVSQSFAEFDIFLEQVRYFEENSYCNESFKGVKGRLAKHADYWEKIGASSFVVDTIKNGYVIPFLEPPCKSFFENNKSAINNSEFVTEAISELVNSGCVVQVPFQPFIVNPLSVATGKTGKRRLILDLSNLNKSIKKEKIKFEDWKIAIQYFEMNSFLFKFDLKSGYLHLDICPQQHTYLGFCWNKHFYCYIVLAFGITTGPYIFTKCLRPLVKYWRENGIHVVLYLDDGFGMCSDEQLCIEQSDFVKKSLSDAGFLVNFEKSVFNPVTELEWLGIIWNSSDFSLSIPNRRIDELLSTLQHILEIFPKITVRLLAQVVGRVISMIPVIGNVGRIMSKYCYMAIETRLAWDKPLLLSNPNFVLSELTFWLNNIHSLNCRRSSVYSKSSVIVYSDASNYAAGAYSVELENKIFHKMWTAFESNRSSTWRELKAI